jgi:hypothetical protein
VRTPTVATTATQEDVIAMIDLTPFESCSPQLREYLEQNVGIQAPGPHRERRKESAPRRRDDIECRRCGRTPAQTGDDVSREAVGFTCSRCLMAEADAYTRPTSAVDIACALDGEHQSDRWANECPVVRRARRPEQGIETSTPYPLRVSPEVPPRTRMNSGDSRRVSIPRADDRAPDAGAVRASTPPT